MKQNKLFSWIRQVYISQNINLGEFMVDAAIESLKETEAVLFVVAGNEKRGPGDNFIIEQLKRVKVPVFLVVNKIDTLKKEELLESIVSYQDAYPFAGGYSYFCKG